MNKSIAIIYKASTAEQPVYKSENMYIMSDEPPEFKNPIVATNQPDKVIKDAIKKETVQTELDSFYRPINADISVEKSVKQIGSCPFSKPMSSALPITNIPMCYAKKSTSHLKNT